MKNLFLKLGLLPALILAAVAFVSCGGNEPTLPDNSVISARSVIALTGSTSEIASVRVGVFESRLPVFHSFAEAPFQNNGFTMQLPATLPDNLLSLIRGSFTDNAAITGNPDARWLPHTALVAFCENNNIIGTFNLIGDVDIENRTGTTARWVYVDSDVSVTDSFDTPCVGFRWCTTVKANLNLRKGWNIVYSYIISVELFGEDLSAGSHTTVSMTTQRPSGVFFVWTFISLEDEFPFNLLDANGFFR